MKTDADKTYAAYKKGNEKDGCIAAIAIFAVLFLTFGSLIGVTVASWVILCNQVDYAALAEGNVFEPTLWISSFCLLGWFFLIVLRSPVLAFCRGASNRNVIDFIYVHMIASVVDLFCLGGLAIWAAVEVESTYSQDDCVSVPDEANCNDFFNAARVLYIYAFVYLGFYLCVGVAGFFCIRICFARCLARCCKCWMARRRYQEVERRNRE